MYEYKLDGATALKVIRETVGTEARLTFIHEVLDALKRPATSMTHRIVSILPRHLDDINSLR